MPIAFDTTHLKYGDLFLPSEYSDILLPNFFYNSFLQPGITYTDRYQMGNSGQIFVPQLKQGIVELKEPCSTFDHKNIGNELLQITLNCTYMSSKKICALQETAINYDLVAETLRLTARELAEAWNIGGLTALITEGTGWTFQITPAINLETLKQDILSAKTQLFKNKRTGKIVLCSPDFYQIILQYAGSSFTPSINDKMVYSGEVGTWLGLTFVNLNLLQEGAGKFEYNDYKWDKQSIHGETIKDIAYIMYDPEAFSVLVNFNRSRMIESPDFMGQYVQSVINSGFRVTDPESVIIRCWYMSEEESTQKKTTKK